MSTDLIARMSIAPSTLQAESGSALDRLEAEASEGWRQGQHFRQAPLILG
jgi:hypothetical protein